jgi:hypothetical protein
VEEEIKKLNLWQKLLLIQKELGTIQKTGNNNFFGYKFIEHRVLVAAVTPLLEKYGVVFMPRQAVCQQDLLKLQAKASEPPKDTFKTLLTMVWIIRNTDKPEEFEEITMQSEALDSQDKGLNKANTANEKQIFMKTFHISDYDPDAEVPVVAQPASNRQQQQRPAVVKPAPTQKPAVAEKPAALKPASGNDLLTDILSMYDGCGGANDWHAANATIKSMREAGTLSAETIEAHIRPKMEAVAVKLGIQLKKSLVG